MATIWRVLARRGFVTREPQKRPRCSWRRFQAELPNECWQADTTHCALAEGLCGVGARSCRYEPIGAFGTSCLLTTAPGPATGLVSDPTVGRWLVEPTPHLRLGVVGDEHHEMFSAVRQSDHLLEDVKCVGRKPPTARR